MNHRITCLYPNVTQRNATHLSLPSRLEPNLSHFLCSTKTATYGYLQHPPPPGPLNNTFCNLHKATSFKIIFQLLHYLFIYDERTTRSSIKAFLRALRSAFQPPPLADRAGLAAEAFAAASDYSGGVRLAAPGDLGGSHALWIGHFLHRLYAHAVGSRIGYVALRRWRRFLSLRSRPFHSLLRYAAQGSSRVETYMKR